MKYYVLGMVNYKTPNNYKLMQSLINSFKSNASADGYCVYLYERNLNSILLHLAHHINNLADVDGFEFLFGTLTHSIAEYIEYYSKEEEHLLLFKNDLEKEFGLKLERAMGPLEIEGVVQTLNIQRIVAVTNNGDVVRTTFHTFKFKGTHRNLSDKEKIKWITEKFVEPNTFSESHGQFFQSGCEIKHPKKNEWIFIESWSRDW